MSLLNTSMNFGELRQACRQDDLLRFDTILKSFSVSEDNSYTILYEAASRKQLLFVELLLEHGVNVNAIDTNTINHDTVLHYACKIGSCSLVQLLLKYGANKDAGILISPLAIACKHNRIPCMGILLQHNADTNAGRNNFPLHIACAANNSALVQLLLKHGADPNKSNGNGKTPFHVAIDNLAQRIIEILMNHGVDMNIAVTCCNDDDSDSSDDSDDSDNSDDEEYALDVNYTEDNDDNAECDYDIDIESFVMNVDCEDNGKTALHMLCCKVTHNKASVFDIVDKLLTQGADVDVMTEKGITPLYYTIARENKVLTKLLLDHGADINMVLRSAIERSNIDVIKACKRYHADMNTATQHGITALHVAVKANKGKLTSKLLNEGVNVNAVSTSGQTALHIAAKAGNRIVARRLLDNGADVNQAALNGTTALHLSIGSNCSWNMIDLLLARGADVNAATMLGITELHLAVQRSNLALVMKLLHAGGILNASYGYAKSILVTDVAHGHGKGVLIEVLLRYDAYECKDMSHRFTTIQKSIALMKACKKGLYRAAQLLIHYGADVNYSHIDGSTALSLACMSNYINIVDLLLLSGANVNGAATSPYNPLFTACFVDAIECFHALIFKGANPNIVSNFTTPLMVAVKKGDETMVQTLLKHGADVGLGYDEITPLFIARLRMKKEIIDLLLHHVETVDEEKDRNERNKSHKRQKKE